MEFGIIEKIIVLGYLIGAFYIFYRIISKRIKIILGNKKVPKVNFSIGIKRVLSNVFTQKVLIRQRVIPGIFHALIFWGFFIFLISTIEMLFFIFTSYSFLEYEFLSIYRFFLDTFALFIIIAVIGLGIRRFIMKPEPLTKPKPGNEVLILEREEKKVQIESFIILLLIFLLMLTYLFESSTGINLGYRNPSGKWFSLMISKFMPENIIFWKINYVLHIFLVFLFLNLIPLSKHFHIINGIINVFLYNLPSPAYIEKIDLEKEDVPWGYSNFKELSFYERLDAFSCIECGRCQDLCPAYNGGSSLSPKYLIVNTRTVLEKGKEEKKLVDSVLKEEALWACTTCGACMYACPLDIKHIPYILNIRRAEVLVEGRFPPELSLFFKNIEQKQNPWGIWQTERTKWMEGLDVPLAKDKKEFEYLYFVGCASAFDDRAQKIARSTVNILNKLNISYAVLGEEEICNGDAARRAGHEYLFQMMVEANIETFKKYKFSKILVHCPHCFYVFKTEYPDFGFKKEVVHITELISELLKQGKLKLKNTAKKYTFHDPCYLGRHSGIFEEPRKIINSLGEIEELERSREFSFCCGAGGARMWMETKKGRPVNQIRMEEIKNKNIKDVIVSCPFCIRMLEDGKKEINAEDFNIMDITEIVEQNILK